MKANQAIGIFDSGIGGLTIAKEIKNIMPYESIIYFSDSQNLPYGDKSKEIVIEYAKKITTFLILKKCKVIVIGCNTISAYAVEEINKIAYNKALVFDVISPVIKQVSVKNYSNIGVIGTKLTINSHIYKTSIQKINADIKIFELATPLLAPIIEKGFYNRLIYNNIILENYLSHFMFSKIELLILGCTHYSIILDEISRCLNNLNKIIEIISSEKIVADSLFFHLKNNNLLYKQVYPKYNFYLSDQNKYFEEIAKIIFGNEIVFKKIILR